MLQRICAVSYTHLDVYKRQLLGGRLSKLNDHLVARLKQRRPENSVASWAFHVSYTHL